MTRAGIAALLLGIAGLQADARAETILFIGNSFTAGAVAEVEHFRPETVVDLNRTGIGGVPALFKAFTRQAGLAYDVHLETAGSTNLDFHFKEKGPLITRAWDHVVLQGYSTLHMESPGRADTIVEYAAKLAQLLHSQNPRVDVRLYATWSRADQTYLESGHWFGKPIDAMAIDVRAAYDAAAARSPHVSAVIPVGEAWNRAIAEGVATSNPYKPVGADQMNLWAEDGYHASAYGSYLAALVIFGSVTGRNPRDLGGDEEAAARLQIPSARARVLQRVAFETLAAESARIAHQ